MRLISYNNVDEVVVLTIVTQFGSYSRDIDRLNATCKSRTKRRNWEPVTRSGDSLVSRFVR